MATIIKVKKGNKIAYRVRQIVNYKPFEKYFPAGTKRAVVEAYKKRIEAQLAEYKAGLLPSIPEFEQDVVKVRNRDKVTLRELMLDIRKCRLQDMEANQVGESTIRRNVVAMQNFIECLGQPEVRRSLFESL